MCMHRLLPSSVALLLLAATAGPAAAACPDCDGDGTVAINELVTGIGIALGSAPLAACPVMDSGGDGAVSIAELIDAINAALGGCPPAASATATPMQTPTPTADGGGVPTDPDALLAWLRADRYRDWPAESAQHPSTGPHGGSVRTFVNNALFASLEAGDAQHPQGAAAVKELYFAGQAVAGWAVMVKLQGDSDRGRGWYWYEYFGPGQVFEGVGLGGCTGCHSQGRDFVRIPFPLQ